MYKLELHPLKVHRLIDLQQTDIDVRFIRNRRVRQGLEYNLGRSANTSIQR